MWAKLILSGLLVLSLVGAATSFVYHQREIGRIEERAKQAEQTAKDEALLAEAAEMARQDAVAQLAIARKRQADTRQQLGAAELSRQAANEALARTSAEYAAWRAVAVPAAVADRLRSHAVAVGANGSGLPSGTGVPAGPLAPAAAADQRGAR